MSLSSRWSLFSRGVKETKQDCDESGHNNNTNNGEEIVCSASKEEVVFSVKEEDANVIEGESMNEKDNISENNMNECMDDINEKVVNEYLKTRTMRDVDNDGNNHYRGFQSEVMPIMPVFFIEEFVPDFDKFGYKKSVSVTDWRAYVYYDSYRSVYVLNGTRRRENEYGGGMERKFPDIRMTFKSKSALAFYLRRSMYSWKHKLSVTMYSMYRNVIHLSTIGAIPSFHSIHHCRNKFRTELFGYDDCQISLKEFKSYLKILKEGSDDGYLFRPTAN